MEEREVVYQLVNAFALLLSRHSVAADESAYRQCFQYIRQRAGKTSSGCSDNFSPCHTGLFPGEGGDDLLVACRVTEK